MPKSGESNRKTRVSPKPRNSPQSPIRKKNKTKRKPKYKGTAIVNDQPVKVRFDRKSVEIIKLTDVKGDTTGITFPTQPEDSVAVPNWASRKNRTSDTKYVTNYEAGEWKREGRFSATPWAKQGQPFYIHAHANPDTFDITVKTESGAKQVVEVDGKTHARLVAGDSDYKRATRDNRKRPIVYMSCKAANRAGRAASDSAAHLHREGLESTIYAPTGTGVRITSGDNSYYGVKQRKDGSGGTFGAFPPK